mgnify:FL=1
MIYFHSINNSDTFAHKIDKYMTACLKNNYGKFFVIVKMKKECIYGSKKESRKSQEFQDQ